MFVLMLISSQADFKAAFDRANESMFGVAGRLRQDARRRRRQRRLGHDARSDRLRARTSRDTLLATLAMIPFMLFWILYPNWGSTLYGEVRGSGDFRKVLRGMLGGIWVTAGLALVVRAPRREDVRLGLLHRHERQLHQLLLRLHDDRPDGPDLELPAAARVVPRSTTRSSRSRWSCCSASWFLGWSGTLFLSSTRMIFAAAFDRVLPERAAQVSERRAVPIIALLYIMIPAIVVSVIYAYSADFRALTLDATLVIAVTFLGSAVAATILPWYKPADLRQLAGRPPQAASSAGPG